jgi:GT2 family glycosyltransferase
MVAPPPFVSVVVPTCGRPALLARCVDALERQTLPRCRYELIVVDDTASRAGPAAARNKGWRPARAPVVAFTDDDTEPDPDWLRAGLAALDQGADAVSGRVRMPLPHPENPSDYERDATGLETAEFVTANCFVRRAVLEHLGGFDERFRLPWREDSDLHFRLLEAGARIARAPRAVVVHPIRPAGFGVSLRQQRKIMFDALLYKKHRRLYRQRIRATPRWDYYLIVACLLLAPFHWAFFLLWLLLSLGFFLQRARNTRRTLRDLGEVFLTSFAIPPLAVFWRLVGALRFRVAFT